MGARICHSGIGDLRTVAPEAAIAPAVFPEEIRVPEPFRRVPHAGRKRTGLTGSPVPYQTVVSPEEPVGISASEDVYQLPRNLPQKQSPKRPPDMAAAANPPQDDLASQPTTTENMPENTPDSNRSRHPDFRWRNFTSVRACCSTRLPSSARDRHANGRANHTLV